MDEGAIAFGQAMEAGGTGGRCPPDPLGFIALSMLQQGRRRPRAGRFRPAAPCCLHVPRSALGSHPCVSLSSAGAKGGFPVSVSQGVYRVGKRKREFELIAFGVVNDFAIGGE